MAAAIRPVGVPSRRYEQSTLGWLAVHSSAEKIRSDGTPAASSWSRVAVQLSKNQ